MEYVLYGVAIAAIAFGTYSMFKDNEMGSYDCIDCRRNVLSVEVINAIHTNGILCLFFWHSCCVSQ